MTCQCLAGEVWILWISQSSPANHVNTIYRAADTEENKKGYMHGTITFKSVSWTSSLRSLYGNSDPQRQVAKSCHSFGTAPLIWERLLKLVVCLRFSGPQTDLCGLVVELCTELEESVVEEKKVVKPVLACHPVPVGSSSLPGKSTTENLLIWLLSLFMVAQLVEHYHPGWMSQM